MIIESLVTFVFASGLICLSPGPDNLFVLTQSALYGKKSGVIITLGLCSGLLVHTSVVVLGGAVVFQNSPVAFNVLTYLGASYLLYLAWQAFTAKPSGLSNGKSDEFSFFSLYMRGIIMNVTNPKVTLFFLAFLPQFASPEHGSLMSQLTLLSGMFIMVALSIFMLIACLADSLGKHFFQSVKNQRLLNGIAGAVFIGLAIRLVVANFA